MSMAAEALGTMSPRFRCPHHLPILYKPITPPFYNAPTDSAASERVKVEPALSLTLVHEFCGVAWFGFYFSDTFHLFDDGVEEWKVCRVFNLGQCKV